MANYSTLKAAVEAVVKTNGEQAITGANMQTVLLSIINSIGGGGYIFEGVATPSTNPGTPDQNVFYLAGAGTYANFGTSVIVPPTNIAVFKYNGSWVCEQVMVENGGVFDISAFKAVGGTLATYADLAAALGTGGANVPEGVRKGGMSVKFVQTSDNKYAQYRLMATSFSTTESDWQGVDDEPTAGSNNMVTSGGVSRQVNYIIIQASGGYCKNENGYLKFKNLSIKNKYSSTFSRLTDGNHEYNEENVIELVANYVLYVLETDIVQGTTSEVYTSTIDNLPNNSIIIGAGYSSLSKFMNGNLLLNELIYKNEEERQNLLGYKYIGRITPSDTPSIFGTNDRVFYTAFESGNYTSFNYTVQRNTIVAFSWDGTSWNHINIKGYSPDSTSYALSIQNDGYCKVENGVLKFKYLLIKSNIDLNIAFLTDGVHTYSEESQITLSGNKIFYILVSDIIGKQLNDTVQLKIDTAYNATNDGTYIYLGITSSVGRNVSGGLLDEIIRQNDINNLLPLKPSSKRIPLNFGLQALSKGSGNFVANSGAVIGSSISTGKFIKIPNDKKFIVNTKNDFTGYYGVAFVWYDSTYTRISDSGWITNIIKDTDYDVSSSIPSNAEYFKMCIYYGTTSTKLVIPEIQMYAEGYFEENPYRYNVRPVDEGYQTLEIPVDVANVDSDNAETATLQDNINMMFDYGLIALPPTYKNEGKPTRLIIYCHGAGVHYTPNTTRFPEGVQNFGVEPEYWLNEGYAVMDIEGDPFDNTNKHFYIPQALQSYIAAYKWVTENYNIAKDGVFLGGRSMGGSMCLDIIYNEIIPVLACCPVAGGFNPIAMWNAMGGASYRQFVATHMGMPNADQVAWTNNNPMSSAEYNYLKNNFKQLLQFTPVWRMIEMVPGQDVLMQDDFNVAFSTLSVPAEKAVYDSLHLKCRVPIKFFVSPEDTSAVANRSSKYVEAMMRNSGSICEYRVLPTGGHSFELESQNRVASYTTRLGITMTDVPIVYIEALQFWRRYELQH